MNRSIKIGYACSSQRRPGSSKYGRYKTSHPKNSCELPFAVLRSPVSLKSDERSLEG